MRANDVLASQDRFPIDLRGTLFKAEVGPILQYDRDRTF